MDFGDVVEDHLWWPEVRPSISISLLQIDGTKRIGLCDGATVTVVESVLSLRLAHVDLRDRMFIEQKSSGDFLALQVPTEAEASISNSYLVAHQISAEAILGCRATEDIKQGECYSIQDVR